MKRALASLRKTASGSSSRRSTRDSSPAAMEEDQRPQLLSDTDLDLRAGRERQAYNLLRARQFGHTMIYDMDFLAETGMDIDFASVWRAVGWTTFAHVPEQGSRLLTLQFLCTLVEVDQGVTFRLFGKEHYLTWRELSRALDFSSECVLGLPASLGFDKKSFWDEITGSSSRDKPRNMDIHNPTLRFMHKWVAFTLFPRDDLRPVREDEMRVLFAMVNKIKISPVQYMIRQWLASIKTKCKVSCTSLITRIARNLGVLDDAHVAYILAPRFLLSYDYWVKGHTLKRGPSNEIIFYYPGYTNEIRLPNPAYYLYNCGALTIPLEIDENVSRDRGRTTRSRARRAVTPPAQQEDWEPWSPAPQSYEAGASGWASGATGWDAGTSQHYEQQEEYGWGHSSSEEPPAYAPRHSYSQGFASLEHRMENLEVRTDEMHNTFQQHFQEQQGWRRSIDTRFDRIDNTLQQTQNSLSAFFAHMGFNPNQAPGA